MIRNLVNYVLLVFVLILLCAAFVGAYFSLYDYIPFVGQAQYFCTKSGTEYLALKNGEVVVPHLRRDGLPVSCEPVGVWP